MWWFAPRLVALAVNGCVESQVSGVTSGCCTRKQVGLKLMLSQHRTCTDTSRYRHKDNTEPAPTHHGTDTKTTPNLHRHTTVPTQRQHRTFTDTSRYRHKDNTEPAPTHPGTDWDRQHWTFTMDKSQMIWNRIQSDKSGCSKHMVPSHLRFT